MTDLDTRPRTALEHGIPDAVRDIADRATLTFHDDQLDVWATDSNNWVGVRTTIPLVGAVDDEYEYDITIEDLGHSMANEGEMVTLLDDKLATGAVITVEETPHHQPTLPGDIIERDRHITVHEDILYALGGSAATTSKFVQLQCTDGELWIYPQHDVGFDTFAVDCQDFQHVVLRQDILLEVLSHIESGDRICVADGDAPVRVETEAVDIEIAPALPPENNEVGDDD